MKRLYEYLDCIHQDDIQLYVEQMNYDEDMLLTFNQGIEELKKMTPIENDNVIFSLYKDVLFVQPNQDNPFIIKKEEYVFCSPLYFVEKMDLSQQFTLNTINQQQALGAYVVVDQDYSLSHMILIIIDTLLNDFKDQIQNQIQKMINDLQMQFPQATISAVNVIADQSIPQDHQIQQMESQIIEKQVDMNQAFEKKTKEYYQSILYS